MELISVIIPAYNAAPYLAVAIDSALAQKGVAVEVIVIDDGSTDESASICRRYGDRIRFIQQSNRGVAAACNRAVSAARGEWIAFLDADDEWREDKLQLQLQQCGEMVISHTDSICHGPHIEGELLRSSFEPPYSGKVLDKLLVTNFITKSSVLMRRDVYLRLGGFDERLRGVEDWHFWLKVCADHDLGYLHEPVLRYRVHEQSKSMQSRQTMTDHLRTINEAFGPGGVGAKMPELRGPALASSYGINCHYAATSGDWRFALYCSIGALRYGPGSLRHWKNLVKSALIPFGVKF